MDIPRFDERRHVDPQGVIDDLVKQTGRQAKAIHEKNKEIERLQAELAKLNGEPKKTKKAGVTPDA